MMMLPLTGRHVAGDDGGSSNVRLKVIQYNFVNIYMIIININIYISKQNLYNMNYLFT